MLYGKFGKGVCLDAVCIENGKCLDGRSMFSEGFWKVFESLQHNVWMVGQYLEVPRFLVPAKDNCNE